MMMQVDEESKKLTNQDDEVLSSEDEQEIQQEEKNKFTAVLTLNSISKGITNVVLCQGANAKSLTKIIFEGMAEVGKAEVT